MGFTLSFSEFMFSVGLLTFVVSTSHYLILLLVLEFIMLSLFLMLSFHVGYFYFGFDFMFIFLTFMIMEGVLGLCLMIFYSKSYGNDMYSVSMN
uniref:NADH dehydrogenase subunit 4L n=1 Tax=Halotydeus destructor TaxID=2874060 RepID=UPI002028C6B9|nr:NADH dehydrogenase subunit 4L [Halotydeus destructor]UPN63260.1 NADH dehydrogenase subunit 4L [Halotydeus destructor]